MSVYTYVGENGNRSHSKFTIGIGGTQVEPRNLNLLAIEIYNNGSNPVFLHTTPNAALAVSDGRPIGAGASYTDAASAGPWFLATSTGTSDVRVTKVERLV